MSGKADDRISPWEYRGTITTLTLLAIVAVPMAIATGLMGDFDLRMTLAAATLWIVMMVALIFLMLRFPHLWVDREGARFSWWLHGAVWAGSIVAGTVGSLMLYRWGTGVFVAMIAGVVLIELPPRMVGRWLERRSEEPTGTV